MNGISDNGREDKSPVGTNLELSRRRASNCLNFKRPGQIRGRAKGIAQIEDRAGDGLVSPGSDRRRPWHPQELSAGHRDPGLSGVNPAASPKLSSLGSVQCLHVIHRAVDHAAAKVMRLGRARPCPYPSRRTGASGGLAPQPQNGCRACASTAG